MTKHMLVTAMVILTLGTQLSQAQKLPTVKEVGNSLKNKGKYAMMVMNSKHLSAALLTGRQLQQRSPQIKFQVIACGSLVKELADNADLKQTVATAAEMSGHQVVICGLSIKQFNVNTANLPKEAVITDNALLYSFGLQELGYKMLIL